MARLLKFDNIKGVVFSLNVDNYPGVADIHIHSNEGAKTGFDDAYIVTMVNKEGVKSHATVHDDPSAQEVINMVNELYRKGKQNGLW